MRKQRKKDLTDFNMTTVYLAVERRNSVGGTEDSLCRLFTKRRPLRAVEISPCSSMKRDAFQRSQSPSLSLPASYAKLLNGKIT